MRYCASALFLAVLISHYFYGNAHAERPIVPLASLPAPVIKTIDLGLHGAAASLLWVKITQDVYTWLGENTNQTLRSDISLVNALDPKWSYPYAFAAIMLPGFNQTKEAIALGEAGMRDALPDWRIPYYLAIAYHTDKDRANAAKYFNLAAETEGSPENTKKVAATYGTGMNAREEMRQIWTTIAESSEDESVRERAKLAIEYIDYLDQLDRAKAGILTELPKNPLED